MGARVYLVVAAALMGSVAHADPAQPDWTACLVGSSDAQRLKCYDELAAKTGQSHGGTAPLPPIPSTREVVSAGRGGPPQAVEAGDLYVAPNKYKGKTVELRDARCFHADLNDYRCVAQDGQTVLIAAPTIAPDAAREQIERDCGQIKKILTPPCRKTVRFTPSSFDMEDMNAFAKKLTITASSIEVAERRERRR